MLVLLQIAVVILALYHSANCAKSYDAEVFEIQGRTVLSWAGPEHFQYVWFDNGLAIAALVLVAAVFCIGNYCSVEKEQIKSQSKFIAALLSFVALLMILELLVETWLAGETISVQRHLSSDGFGNRLAPLLYSMAICCWSIGMAVYFRFFWAED